MMNETEKQPLVSVVMPCYNAAEYLPETLDSLFAQTFADFEVIAVDDGSTDDTLAVLQQYAEKDIRLKVISQENTYYVIARANAVALAKGKYLVCLDSDDKLAPEYMEKCVAVAEQNPDVSVVYSNVRLFGRENKDWRPNFDLKSFLLSNGLYVTALIRKAHFDAAGGFDTGLTMNEDWDLFISMIKRGGKVYKIPETLFFYRQRENLSSVCNTASKEKKSDNLLKIYNKHYDFYKENGIYFHEMMEMLIKKEKHYNMPLRKWFYKWFKPKRYQALYEQ